MTRIRLKILSVMGLIAIVFLGIFELEPQYFDSLNVNFIRGGFSGILLGIVWLFALISWNKLEIIDKKED